MKESEIRPQKLFNQYLQLAKKDNEIFFSDHSRFTEIPCPSCGNEKQMPGLKNWQRRVLGEDILTVLTACR